jgi:hypothetical protein
MLEINHERVQAIANMPTKHSWAADLMKLEPYEADLAEDRVCKWITETMQIMYPETDYAERIVRTMWLHRMEKEAISAYLQEHPWLYGIVPEVMDAEEAVYVGAADLLGVASEEDEEAAKAFLELMDKGYLKPDQAVLQV